MTEAIPTKKLIGSPPGSVHSAQPAIKYLDRAPPGWFVLTVVRKGACGWDWAAGMIDADPDQPEYCSRKKK
jgi:hypothetical protein